uniref:Vestitone reductase-like n=1 Tax=Populus alba TaxID=43335 RepID=A0A4U5N0B5_POPAL|nr:vestitone reductase-like [Populus alba]
MKVKITLHRFLRPGKEYRDLSLVHGFIASCLITRLLEQGYAVRATVRSLDGNKDISYLTGLPGAKERLQIFKADLNEPESFNEAIEGCAGVLHLAPSLDLVDGEPEEICSKLNRAPSNI